MYVVPIKDVVYNKNSIFTAHKIYKVVKRTDTNTGFMLINDEGILDYLDDSLVRSRYEKYQLALLHNRIPDTAIIILLVLTGLIIKFS